MPCRGGANLSPYRPSGWSDAIVLTNSPGSTIDATVLRSTDPVYLSFAVVNNGGSSTAVRFYTAIQVDGATVGNFYSDPPIDPGVYVYGTDYNLGLLSPGVHTVRVIADSTGVIAEDDENDNTYTKTFNVTNVPVESWLYAVDDGSDDGSSTLFRLGTSPVSGGVGLQVVGETGVKGIFDITFVGDRLIGVAPGSYNGLSGDLLVQIEPDSGQAQTIGTLQPNGDFNALETEGPDTFVGATSEGEFWRFDLSTKNATRVGTYGNGLQSGGDLALDPNGVLYGTVTGFFSDALVRINRSTGEATSIGSLGYGSAYGLAIRPDNGTLLAVVDADSDPLLVSVDKSSGQATAIGAIPAPAGLAGLAVRGSAQPAQLSAGNVTLGNTSKVANAIDVWLDVTLNGAPATDLSGYSLRFVAADNSPLTTAATPQRVNGSRWHASMTILQNPLRGVSCSAKNCFEGGRLQVYSASGAGTPYTVPNLIVNVYGTLFDMGKHSYSFRNGAWGTPAVTWFTDPYFRAADTVAAYVTPSRRDDFWKSVGQWRFLILVFGMRAEGLCYGMANSSIASFTHRGSTSYWADRDASGSLCTAATYCYFNSATDNSWQKGIDSRWLVASSDLAPGAADNPYPAEDVYDATYSNGAWTLMAAKKIFYYFVTQNYFMPVDGREWPGKDNSLTPVAGVNAAADPGMIGLLRDDIPVSLSIKFEPFNSGGHEVVGTELIQWGATSSSLSSELIVYDNNLPLSVSETNSYAPYERLLFENGTQALSLDLVRPDDGATVAFPGTTMTLANLQYIPGAADSENIYNLPGEPFQAAALRSAGDEPSYAASADSIVDTSYAKVIAVGADSFKVFAGTANTEVSVTKNGVPDGSTAVYVHDTGDLTTELYLPATNSNLYRVEMVKSTTLSRLKIFTSVPADSASLIKRGYDDIQVSATDSTKAVFYVGRSNTNDKMTRVSAASVQDQVGPTFAVTVPITPGKRRAVKH